MFAQVTDLRKLSEAVLGVSERLAPDHDHVRAPGTISRGLSIDAA